MTKSVAVASGADAYVESNKETRPDFKELKKIEKERREILLRVSFMSILSSCVHMEQKSYLVIFHLTSFFPYLDTGGTSILEDSHVLEWNMS